MQVFHNKIAKNTLDIFREHYAKHSDDPNLNEDFYLGGEIKTLMLPESSAGKEIRKICNNHFSQDAVIYANYQRQSNPTKLHVDSNGEKDETTHTIIIPMHTDLRIGAVIFKERFGSDQDFKRFLEHFRYEKKEKLSNISEKYDLEHTAHHWKTGDKLVDFLELDGAFEYTVGDYVLFESNQLHTSINFKGYPEYKFKDIVQIHIADKNYKKN